MKKHHVTEITITHSMVDDDIPQEPVIYYTTTKIPIPPRIQGRITQLIDPTIQKILNIIKNDMKSLFFLCEPSKEVLPDDPRLNPLPRESTNGDHFT